MTTISNLLAKLIAGAFASTTECILHERLTADIQRYSQGTVSNLRSYDPDEHICGVELHVL